MPTLWARTAKYESIQVGDELPILVKHETQQTIDEHARLARLAPAGPGRNLHVEVDYARTAVFGGTVNSGAATVAYVAELLEKAFPIERLMAKGSRLDTRATEPFRPGDVVTFSGAVTGKREADGGRFVSCEIVGVNQLGQKVAVAKARVAF